MNIKRFAGMLTGAAIVSGVCVACVVAIVVIVASMPKSIDDDLTQTTLATASSSEATTTNATMDDGAIPEPGSCPTLVDIPGKPCNSECKVDYNCRNTPFEKYAYKCCFNGCAMQCRKAIGEPTPEIKSGICSADFGEATTEASQCNGRTDQCSNDEQCPDSNKCCHDGCAKVCQPPIYFLNIPDSTT